MPSSTRPTYVMGLPGEASCRKKQTMPPGGLNATSPRPNERLGFSSAPATPVPTYTAPGIWCTLPPSGRARSRAPTVRGARCFFSSTDASEPPTRATILALETKAGGQLIGLYNRFPQIRRLSEPEAKAAEPEQPEIDDGLAKAIEAYRKLAEDQDLSDSEKAAMEERVKAMTEREIIGENVEHEPAELPADSVEIGPPVLTRFEKARIMGARALQLSLGAPPFVEIPATAKRSLEIAMDELEKKIIPIVIKRVLPNGDYQNLPIDRFK